ncbi:MAG: hypothetical protein WBA77_15005 [Microcoleaceae cyanobacterium]
MNMLNQEEIKNLVDYQSSPCISIYFPTHPAGPEVRQDPIRHKNALSEAEDQLTAMGLQPEEIKKLLKPAVALDDPDFWQYQGKGLSIFIAPNFFKYYTLPMTVEELVVVGDRFQVKPLMPLLTNNGRFYLLALSQNQVKLFQGSHYSMSEVSVDSIPQSLAEALKYDDPETEVIAHTGSRGGAAGQTSILHSQNVGFEDDNSQIKRFCQQIDKGVKDRLNDENVPLILAGVEFVTSIYKEANTSPHLMDEVIEGNPENVSPDELHQDAWKIVEPYFHQSQEKANTEYKELTGNAPEKVSQDLKEIVKAAHYQRIDTLFIAANQQQWGQFNPEENTVDLHSQPESEDDDLLNLAALHTFLNGGTVYITEPEEIPAKAVAAAIFRY